VPGDIVISPGKPTGSRNEVRQPETPAKPALFPSRNEGKRRKKEFLKLKNALLKVGHLLGEFEG